MVQHFTQSRVLKKSSSTRVKRVGKIISSSLTDPDIQLSICLCLLLDQNELKPVYKGEWQVCFAGILYDLTKPIDCINLQVLAISNINTDNCFVGVCFI